MLPRRRWRPPRVQARWPKPGSPDRECHERDRLRVSTLICRGLRSGEALAVRWCDVRDRTITVDRAFVAGGLNSTKTHRRRAVALIRALAAERAASGPSSASDYDLVVPNLTGGFLELNSSRARRRTGGEGCGTRTSGPMRRATHIRVTPDRGSTVRSGGGGTTRSRVSEHQATAPGAFHRTDPRRRTCANGQCGHGGVFRFPRCSVFVPSTPARAPVAGLLEGQQPQMSGAFL